MHRIDSPGATVGNLFTEGNPSLSIPATEVSDDWLNDVQEELANFIEGQGITLAKGTQTQLQAAIFSAISTGGTSIKLDPLANDTANQDVTGLIFDKTVTKTAFILADIDRRTDTQNVQQTALWLATYDIADDVWRISNVLSAFDDAGVVPSITAAGQVEVTTDDLTGASYAGELRAIAFKLNL